MYVAVATSPTSNASLFLGPKYEYIEVTVFST